MFASSIGVRATDAESVETMISKLLSCPPGSWELNQVVCTDWYDGPRNGFCALRIPPAEFYFDLIAERRDPDGLDDRLFQASEINPGTVRDLCAAMRGLGEPQGRVWSPVWTHPDASHLESLRKRIDEVIERIAAPQAVVFTRDWRTFLGYWKMPRSPEQIGDSV